MADYSQEFMDEVYTYSQKIGIPIDPDWYIEAQKAGELAVIQGQAQQTLMDNHKGRWAALVEQFNRLYPRFLQTLIGVGEVLITATQTILISFGVPVVLFLLLIVEQQRVVHGMTFFETNATLAGFGASVLVAVNLILEVLIHYREQSASWKEPPRHEFSLRLWWTRLLYILGRSSAWEPRPKSPAQKERYALRIVTVGILVLALMGSMSSIIEQANGNWAAALGAIVTQSTLMELMTWMGGLLFAFAAVTTAQVLATYVSQRVAEIVLIMQSNVDDKSSAIAKAAGLASAMHLMARLKEAQRLRVAAARAMSVPSGEAIVPVKPLSTDSRKPDESWVDEDRVKLTPMVKKVMKYLSDHPDQQETPLRPLAEAIEADWGKKVSHETIRLAKKAMRQ